jgi:hypothetical protein
MSLAPNATIRKKEVHYNQRRERQACAAEKRMNRGVATVASPAVDGCEDALSRRRRRQRRRRRAAEEEAEAVAIHALQALYHGTSLDSAMAIQRSGFVLGQPMHGAIMGRGVYLTPDFDKARSYADRQGAIMIVKVDLGNRVVQLEV